MRISDWSSDVCSSDLEAFEHVGAFHVLVMPAWQPVEGEGLLDRFLGPVGEPGIFGAPSGEPLGEIGAGLGEVAPVVEPAQFLQAVVVGLPWQVFERVPQDVQVAALVCGAGQHLAVRRAQAGMIVGDDELGAMQAPVTPAQQEVRSEEHTAELPSLMRSPYAG